MTNNTVKHNFRIGKDDRNQQRGHTSFLIWFTGLSGSGKSTIANALEQKLFEQGIATYVLDGDNVRQGLNKDLTFSDQDRVENIRRIAEVANLLVDAGNVVIAAFIAPFQQDRENIRAVLGADNYVEVFVNTSLEECERRDVKGLYAKARSGEIKEFTGISSPYEAPASPDITIDTEKESVQEAVLKVMEIIAPKLQSHE